MMDADAINVGTDRGVDVLFEISGQGSFSWLWVASGKGPPGEVFVFEQEIAQTFSAWP